MGRSYLAVIIFQGLAAVAAFSALRWLGTYVEPEAFGQYTLYLSIVSAGTLVLISWPNAALLRYGREEWIEHGRIGRTLGARLGLYVICTTGAIAGAWLFADRLRTLMGVSRSPFLLIACALVVSPAAEFAIYVNQAIGRTAVYGYAPAITRFVFLASVLAIPHLQINPTWTYLASSFIAATALSFLFSILTAPRSIWSGFQLEKNTVLRVVKYSWTLPLAALNTFIVGSVDSWVIRHYDGLAAVGVYGWAYQATSLGALAFAPIAVVLTPGAIDARVRGRTAELNRFAAVVLPAAVVSAFAVAVGLAALFPVMRLIVAPAYLDAYPSMLLLVSALPFQLIAYLVAPLGNAYERSVPRFVTTSVVTAVINVAGDFLLVPRLGMVGAALATFVSFAAAALMFILVIRMEGIRFASIPSYVSPALVVIPAIAVLLWLGPARGATAIAVVASVASAAILKQHISGMRSAESLLSPARLVAVFTFAPATETSGAAAEDAIK
jgi:O-antigen/teichoic acid export membrane protein